MAPITKIGRKNSNLSEDEKLECIEQLKKMLQNDKNLQNLQNDNTYLGRFLYSTNFDVDAAFDKMKTFYETLLEFPDWFTRESPLDKKAIIEKDIRLMTDQRDKEGRPIYIVNIGNVDVSLMNITDVIAVDDMWMEYILDDPNVQTNGLCVIIDIAGFSWKLMKWLTPHNIRAGVKKLECFPIKTFRLHVVNTSFLISAAIKLVWPFLSENIKEMVKFHFNDFDSLHEYIDPDVLPEEYKGTATYQKEVRYSDLFEQNDKIAASFKVHRSIIEKL